MSIKTLFSNVCVINYDICNFNVNKPLYIIITYNFDMARFHGLNLQLEM